MAINTFILAGLCKGASISVLLQPEVASAWTADRASRLSPLPPLDELHASLPRLSPPLAKMCR